MAFQFNEPLRPSERRDHKQRVSRTRIANRFIADRSIFRQILGSGDEPLHFDDILHRHARFFEYSLQIAPALASLTCEIKRATAIRRDRYLT